MLLIVKWIKKKMPAGYDMATTIRETIDQTPDESAKRAQEGALFSMDNFSFHAACGNERGSKLETLRSVRALNL
jgi:hypothetical protein